MWQKNVRYLDYNASSGISDNVRNKLKDILDRSDFYFANPSSLHRLGQQSQQFLLRAGLKIAASLGKNINSNQLVFTSSGTEANQTVIKSAMKTAEVMIIGAGEHSASHDLLSEIPESIQKYELPLLSNGQYDLEFLKELLISVKQSGCSKVFLSLFWANNETGVTTSITKLDEVLRSSELSISLHLDGAQVWGKLEIDLDQTPANFITFSGHKIGAPAGSGLIWIRSGSTLHSLISGSQSRGLRGGTENLLSIAAVSFAAEELNSVGFQKHTLALRERLEKGLADIATKNNTQIKIWGAQSNRITNTCRLSISGFEKHQNWVEMFDLKGFAVSHGSACKSSIVEPSRILLKMGATKDEALNTIRVSFGPESKPGDVDDFLIAFQGILSEKGGRT